MKYIPLYFLLAVSLACASTDGGTRVIRLGHGLDVSHSVHKAMVYMADVLREKSGGSLEIRVYPSQQLGTERECLELLQIGGLGMTKVSSGVLENFSPKMKVFGLPFIFRDKQHLFKFLDSKEGRGLLDESRSFNLRGLAYYDSGSRSFYTKNKPINKPGDLAGLKIRVMESVTAMDMVRELGGSPTPISWGELYTSLQQGVVDGAENNPPSFYLSRHYEVCKYYSLDEHTFLPDILIIGTYLWERLTEQEQQWMEEAAIESVKRQRVLWEESERESLEAVEAAGVEIIRPDKSQFADQITGLVDKYKKDPQLKALIEAIQSM